MSGASNDELMIGVVAPGDPDDAPLIRGAGIEWIRLGAPFPFADRVGGELAEPYLKFRAHARAWADAGLRIMGVTPGPGVKLRERDGEGNLQLVWHRHLPEWCGELGSRKCQDAYEAVCARFAEDLRGVVGAWQIGNELDWHQFAGPLNARQACDFILSGARGLKGADPSLICGHNLTGNALSYFFYGRLFGGSDGLLDYCGIDRYFGSWQPGGPEDWAPLIQELWDLTGAPVLINEWGFASAGGVMTAEDRAAGAVACECGRWPHTWGPGHTPEGQAEFIGRAFDAFAEVRRCLLGQFYFRWADQETCWQCGAPGCAAETAWGLVDLQGRPKPSYEALKEGVRRLRAQR